MAPRPGSVRAKASGGAPRRSTCRSATSRSGSNSTGTASRTRPPGAVTRIPRVRAGHDVRVGDDVAMGDAKPLPTDEGAGRGGDLDRARLGYGRDRPRRGIVRQVDRRAGQRLEADEHVGQPGLVEEPPRPTASSVGGGSIAVIVRTAFEPLAVWARRGIGPSAIRLPASHTMRNAWANPRPSPCPVGGADDAVAEPRATARPSPPDRFADADRGDDAPTTSSRRTGSIPDSGSASQGGRRWRRPRRDRAGQPADLGDRPGAPAQDHADHEEHQRDCVHRVHRPDRPTGRATAAVGRSTLLAPACRSVPATGQGQATTTGMAAAPPGVADRVRARRRSPRSTSARLNSAISMHTPSAGRAPRVARCRACVPPTVTTINRGRCTARRRWCTRPSRHLPPAVDRRERLGPDRVEVDLPGLGDHDPHERVDQRRILAGAGRSVPTEPLGSWPGARLAETSSVPRVAGGAAAEPQAAMPATTRMASRAMRAPGREPRRRGRVCMRPRRVHRHRVPPGRTHLRPWPGLDMRPCPSGPSAGVGDGPPRPVWRQ